MNSQDISVFAYSYIYLIHSLFYSFLLCFLFSSFTQLIAFLSPQVLGFQACATEHSLHKNI